MTELAPGVIGTVIAAGGLAALLFATYASGEGAMHGKSANLRHLQAGFQRAWQFRCANRDR
jgi:hypothetical protein